MLFLKDSTFEFRKDLNLSVREFGEIFDFSPATIHRIETGKSSGKDALKRIEIYYKFPEVALSEVEKNGFKIHDEKRKLIEDKLRQKLS